MQTTNKQPNTIQQLRLRELEKTLIKEYNNLNKSKNRP